jgi:YHS domain-containing protein
MRLVFYGALLLLLWLFVVRPLLARFKIPRLRPRADELVKDPVCQTYLPRSRALFRTIRGEPQYFCSEACLRRYISPPSLRG